MDNIIIPDQTELTKKIEAIKQEGKDSLHIISDFDRTITKAFSKGKKIPSLIYHLRNEHYLTEDYSAKAFALYEKYHPLEVSTTVSDEKKNKAMLEWWSTHYKLLVESGLNEKTIKQAIKDIVKKQEINLRLGVNEFLKLVGKRNIPLVVLSSSGVGNMILELLKELKVMNNNIHFIGNTLEFDKEGKFIGVKDNKIIHSFNKNEAELASLSIYQELIKRKNVILLGDSLGDIKMIEGFPYNNLIKIGFYNDATEENIEDFKKNFDVVITNDGSFEYINQLLKEILN